MRTSLSALILLLAAQVYDTARLRKTIDEIIMESAPLHDMFDLVHDMGDGNMMTMVELDMLMSFSELAHYRSGQRSRWRRKATSNDRQLWENCNVYYELADQDFSLRDRNVIMDAINEWQNYTCLRFTESSTESSRIFFRNGAGCYSRLGRTGGVQPIGLAPGCRTKGVVVHEIGHAIGWIHEQARPDRDQFVFVNFTKIPPNWHSQFEKVDTRLIDNRGVTYDYDSIMHYSGNVFGRGTIKTPNPDDQDRLGQREGLSFRDIKIANLMYECAETMSCRPRRCPGEGFQGKDCKCYCPGPLSNPVVECQGGPAPATSTVPTTTQTVPPVPTVPTTIAPPAPDCMDVRDNCAALRLAGSCTTDQARMSVFCRQTCDLCNTAAACMDYDDACPLLASNGYCERDGLDSYVKEFCPLSCKVCTATERCPAESDSQSGSLVNTASILGTLVMLVVAANM